jgi:ribosomal protein L37AE/L43A
MEFENTDVQKVQVTTCTRCKAEINILVNIFAMMIYCPKCKVMVANPYYNKQLNLEQEVKMVDKKNKTAKINVKSSEIGEKASGILVKRQENADDVIKFMRETLTLNDVEIRKVFSRAYNIIAKNQKK